MLTPVLQTIEPLYRALGPGRPSPWSIAGLAFHGCQPGGVGFFGGSVTEAARRTITTSFKRWRRCSRSSDASGASLFPRLLNAMSSPAVAAPILDLANFLTREKLVPLHPAAEVADELVNLLGELVQTLLLLEERPDQFGDSPQEVSQRVARGMALAVSLCDALALIGDKRAIGKLYQRTARGTSPPANRSGARPWPGSAKKQGATELVQLAAEPIARLRVLAYAEGTGHPGQDRAAIATPEARAEAELCVWLAEPTQYGVPPTSCELFDHRQQHWPGFDEPVDCYLFQFQYVVSVEATASSRSATSASPGRWCTHSSPIWATCRPRTFTRRSPAGMPSTQTSASSRSRG